jgi:UDP-glucose 4-epimerase
MKVLIFGVSGNSGRFLSEFYLKQGAEVWGVGRKPFLQGIESVKYIQGDIRDLDLFAKLPANFDIVVNFAGVQPSILMTSEKTDMSKTLREYVDVNMLGVFNILEYIRTANIGTYVFATTHRDYEMYWSNNTILKNDLPPAINYTGDHTMYAITKVVGRMMGDYMVRLGGTRVFNVRLPMIFLVPESPYYLSNGKPEIMPFLKIIKDAMAGKELQIWGDPNMPRDYVYIQNLLSLIDCCYNSELNSGTFSVGTGEGATTERFVRTIGEVFSHSKQLKYIYKPERKTYKNAVYDVTQQNRLLGYRPVLLREMLELMKNKIYNENYITKWGWK